MRLDLPRVRLARRTFQLDLLGRFLDEDQCAFRAGNATLDHDEISCGVDSYYLVAAGGGPLVAHLAGHAHTLEDARGVCRADGAGLADVHRAVALGTAAELVALDEALETLALAGARDVDELAGLEDLGRQVLALLEAVVVADLDDVAVGVDARLLELAEPRGVESTFSDGKEGDARGGVAVLLGRPQAEDLAGPGLEHRHRGHRPVEVEELGHAQLLGEESFHRSVSS